jgi:hypothetical protein
MFISGNTGHLPNVILGSLFVSYSVCLICTPSARQLYQIIASEINCEDRMQNTLSFLSVLTALAAPAQTAVPVTTAIITHSSAAFGCARSRRSKTDWRIVKSNLVR